MAKRRTDNTMDKRRTDNTMAKRRTDNTMVKRRTDNTMAKRRTNNTMAKRRTKDKQRCEKTIHRLTQLFRKGRQFLIHQCHPHYKYPNTENSALNLISIIFIITIFTCLPKTMTELPCDNRYLIIHVSKSYITNIITCNGTYSCSGLIYFYFGNYILCPSLIYDFWLPF
jgi:hypothetical protein